MMFEKTILGSDFKALGLFEKFTVLGWEAVLGFKGHPNGDVYVKSIMEWMSMLTKDDVNDPPPPPPNYYVIRKSQQQNSHFVTRFYEVFSKI
ncbi:hypothetical protein Hanom_Chr05g00460271 [Helianthus anomalus]